MRAHGRMRRGVSMVEVRKLLAPSMAPSVAKASGFVRLQWPIDGQNSGQIGKRFQCIQHHHPRRKNVKVSRRPSVSLDRVGHCFSPAGATMIAPVTIATQLATIAGGTCPYHEICKKIFVIWLMFVKEFLFAETFSINFPCKCS